MDAVSTVSPPPDMFAYWAVSDVFTEEGLPAESVAFHGGFGLISLYGVRKPGYRAFELLHNAGDWRVPHHTGAPSNLTVLPLLNVSTKQLRVLLAGNGYVGEAVPNRTVHMHGPFDRDLHAPPLPSTHGAAVSSVAKGTLWRIDEKNCNPKALWSSWGSPNYLKPGQVKQLNDRSKLTATHVDITVNASGWFAAGIDVPAFGLAVLDVDLAHLPY